MNNKKETSLGMYVNDNKIRINDLVSYNKFELYNKNRFEPLKSNMWIVRGIKKKYGKPYIYVRHFEQSQIVIGDELINFKKEMLI